MNPSVVFITGASSGLGAALAKELLTRGHSVGLTARRLAPMEQLAAAFPQSRVCIAQVDVTDPDSIDRGFSTLQQALGDPDVVVANAGIEGKVDVTQFDLASTRRAFDVNFFGALATVKAVLPTMLEQGRGLLVVVSSVASNRGLPKSAAYSASKAAISVYWEGLRVDLQGTGVECMTIHPGFVATPMTSNVKHPMPFLIDDQEAGRQMADAIERRATHLTFPWQMRLVERVMRWAPNWLYLSVIGKASKDM